MYDTTPRQDLGVGGPASMQPKKKPSRAVKIWIYSGLAVVVLLLIAAVSFTMGLKSQSDTAPPAPTSQVALPPAGSVTAPAKPPVTSVPRSVEEQVQWFNSQDFTQKWYADQRAHNPYFALPSQTWTNQQIVAEFEAWREGACKYGRTMERMAGVVSVYTTVFGQVQPTGKQCEVDYFIDAAPSGNQGGAAVRVMRLRTSLSQFSDFKFIFVADPSAPLVNGQPSGRWLLTDNY